MKTTFTTQSFYCSLSCVRLEYASYLGILLSTVIILSPGSWSFVKRFVLLRKWFSIWIKFCSTGYIWLPSPYTTGKWFTDDSIYHTQNYKLVFHISPNFFNFIKYDQVIPRHICSLWRMWRYLDWARQFCSCISINAITIFYFHEELITKNHWVYGLCPWSRILNN